MTMKYEYCDYTQDGSEDHIISRCGKTTITVSAKATNQAEIYERAGEDFVLKVDLLAGRVRKSLRI